MKIRCNVKINYKDPIQLDGAFVSNHKNYGKSPMFNGESAKNIMTCENKEENSDIESDVKNNEKIIRWKYYWLEYINAFEKMKEILPESVATAYLGRQAIEVGIKYLLKKNKFNFKKTHDLGDLAKMLYESYDIKDDYMDYVDIFCEKYGSSIEEEQAEYFRYPEYIGEKYFAGESLDIRWLTYNFSVVLSKLLHFAGLDE